MSHKIFETDENTPLNEMLGLMQHSIMSSIIGCAQIGLSKDVILAIKHDIDSLSSSLWSLVPFSIEIGMGEKEQIIMRDKIIKQIDRIIIEYKEKMNNLTEQTQKSYDEDTE